MLCNHALRWLVAVRFTEGWHQPASNRGAGNALGRRMLIEGNMRRRHGLATILMTVVVRRAPHRVAALHCLFRRTHADTVECIRRESDGHCREKDSPYQPHLE